MPYGLTGAPTTFQRLFNKHFGPKMSLFAFVYLDDIIIATKTFEKNMHWLRIILAKIRVAGLAINPESIVDLR